MTEQQTYCVTFRLPEALAMHGGDDRQASADLAYSSANHHPGLDKE